MCIWVSGEAATAVVVFEMQVQGEERIVAGGAQASAGTARFSAAVRGA